MKDLITILEVEDMYPVPEHIINKIKKLANTIEFPDIEKFVKGYYNQFLRLEIEQSSSFVDSAMEYYKEMEKLKQFLDSAPEITTVSIRTEKGTFKVKNAWIINGIIGAAYEDNMPYNKRYATSKVKPKKINEYNKKFIRNLKPLFTLLKKHNKISDLKLYSFLREFIDILGFNFAERYPTSDEELFKLYFRNI